MARPAHRTYGNALDQGRARLSGAGLDLRESAVQARWLLAHVCGCGQADLRSRAGAALDAGRFAKYMEMVGKRVSGEPLQYIIGSQSFMGYDFAVDSRVLIPRLDTEMLCVYALESLPEDAEATVLDVGTGSGALAVSVALRRPRTCVTAVEIDENALDVARANAARLDARVRFVHGDFFSGVPGERFDLIVSNPPYIARDELAALPPDVCREPRLALDGGSDGLEAYRALARDGAAHLLPGGRMIVEVGETQAGDVSALLAGGIGPTDVLTDLQGARRFVRAALRI